MVPVKPLAWHLGREGEGWEAKGKNCQVLRESGVSPCQALQV